MKLVSSMLVLASAAALAACSSSSASPPQSTAYDPDAQVDSSSSQDASTDTGKVSSDASDSSTVADAAAQDTGSDGSIVTYPEPPDPLLFLTSERVFTLANPTLVGEAREPDKILSATWALDDAPEQALTLDKGTFSIPVTLTPGRHSIRLAATTTSSQKSVGFVSVVYDPKLPSSYAKIMDAFKGGKLDKETALLYRVYAEFGHPALPSEYKGFDALSEPPSALDEARETFDSLSPALQEKLHPFFKPAHYQGSWWSLLNEKDRNRELCPPIANLSSCSSGCMSTHWQSKAAGNIRVWYRDGIAKDLASADQVIDAIEGTGLAWSKLVGVMGKEPVKDKDAWCNGGDDKLDIVILPWNIPGKAIPYNVFKVQPFPSYIYLDAGQSDADKRAAVVHELMHAFQFAFKVKNTNIENYKFLSESTADWAVDFVWRKSNQWEQPHAHYFSDATEERLTSTGTTGDNARAYGGYLFHMFLEHTYGAGLIRTMWEQAEGKGEVEAIDGAISSRQLKFNDVWKKFGAALWNNAGQGGGDYDKWDDLRPLRASAVDFPSLGGKTEVDEYLHNKLTPLSLQYMYFQFPAGSTVHSVVVLNGLSNRLENDMVQDATKLVMPVSANVLYRAGEEQTKKRVSFQILTKVNGKWKSTDDITEATPSYRMYCRDNPDQRVEEMVVIAGFGDPKATDDFVPESKYSLGILSNMVCDQATLSADLKRTTEKPEARLTVTGGKMRLFAPYAPAWGSGGTAILGFEMVGQEGQMEHKISGKGSDDCEVSSEWKGAFNEGSSGSLHILPFARGADRHGYVYWRIPNEGIQTSVTSSCTTTWALGVGTFWTFVPLHPQSQTRFLAETNGEYRGTAEEQFNTEGAVGQWSIKGTNGGI